jgi:mRNA interferase RelE/StbE
MTYTLITPKPFQYRIRVGDYRIRYQIDDEKQDVTLLHCRHRREVYRN